MSRYRKVLIRIWEDEKFRNLSESGQRLFLYHLTSPRSTPFLLYVEGPGSVSDALAMASGRLRDVMKEVEATGMAMYADDGSQMVFIPNALMFPENAPQSGNAVKTWVELFADLPKTAFRDKCLRHWGSHREGIAHRMTKGFLDALRKAYPMPYDMATIQEQEQEQDGKISDLSISGFGMKRRSEDDDKEGRRARDGAIIQAAERILTFFNERAGRHWEARTRSTGRPSPNLQFIILRLKDGATEDECRAVIARKHREWTGDPKMAGFLRPETVFNKTKFATYLGELGRDPENGT